MPIVRRRPLLAVLALLLLVPLLPGPADAAPGDLTDEERQRIAEAENLTDEERAAIEQADDLTGAEQARIDGAREAVSQVEARIATVEDEIAATEAELDRLDERLTRVSKELSHAQAVAEAAEEAARKAQEQVERIRGQLAEAQQARDSNTQQVQSLARDTFMYGPGSSDPMMMIVGGLNAEGGTSDLAQSSHSLDMALRDRTAVMEDSERLVAETELLEEEAALLEEARQDRFDEADQARARAAELHAQVLELVEETDNALHRQQGLKAELAQEQANAEAAVQETVAAAEAAANRRAADARAAAEAAADDRAADARSEAEAAADDRAEAARQEAAEEARREAEEAAAAAAAREEEEEEQESSGSSGSSSSGSSSSGSSSSGSSSSGSSSSGGSVSVSQSGGLATVGGITVDASIADELRGLLEAARADGIVLGGYGWRSSSTTVALRKANGCPDVYNSPASSCRIPTARPGTSMHEKGLAVDFSYNGGTLCYPYSASSCHGNRAFDWLRSNASRYGFYNLPSEAWHWSTNGN